MRHFNLSDLLSTSFRLRGPSRGGPSLLSLKSGLSLLFQLHCELALQSDVLTFPIKHVYWYDDRHRKTGQYDSGIYEMPFRSPDILVNCAWLEMSLFTGEDETYKDEHTAPRYLPRNLLLDRSRLLLTRRTARMLRSCNQLTIYRLHSLRFPQSP